MIEVDHVCLGLVYLGQRSRIYHLGNLPRKFYFFILLLPDFNIYCENAPIVAWFMVRKLMVFFWQTMLLLNPLAQRRFPGDSPTGLMLLQDSVHTTKWQVSFFTTTEWTQCFWTSFEMFLCWFLKAHSFIYSFDSKTFFSSPLPSLMSTWHELESSQRRKPQLRKWLLKIGCRQASEQCLN